MNRLLALAALALIVGGCATTAPDRRAESGIKPSAAVAAAIMGYHGPLRPEPVYGD